MDDVDRRRLKDKERTAHPKRHRVRRDPRVLCEMKHEWKDTKRHPETDDRRKSHLATERLEKGRTMVPTAGSVRSRQETRDHTWGWDGRHGDGRLRTPDDALSRTGDQTGAMVHRSQWTKDHDRAQRTCRPHQEKQTHWTTR